MARVRDSCGRRPRASTTAKLAQQGRPNGPDRLWTPALAPRSSMQSKVHEYAECNVSIRERTLPYSSQNKS